MGEKSGSADEALRGRLTDEQYRITQEGATERAFTGRYVDCKDQGIYRCICCGTGLFSSDTKYDSGSGWPSFWLPLAGDNVRVLLDRGHGMIRQEVRCAACDAHLGHVFEDGPQPTGQRFCINSGALDLVPNNDTDASADDETQTPPR